MISFWLNVEMRIRRTTLTTQTRRPTVKMPVRIIFWSFPVRSFHRSGIGCRVGQSSPLSAIPLKVGLTMASKTKSVPALMHPATSRNLVTSRHFAPESVPASVFQNPCMGTH